MIMTTRDCICAQNWIEQFRRNRQDFIGSEDYYYYPKMQESPYTQSLSRAISRAFTWALTPEGRNVWDYRDANLRMNARLTR
jgi:hypothetical protein